MGGLFARHGRMVYGICRAMLRDVHEAEDATQQVFLSAHKALLGGGTVRDAGGWLATITRNECRARIAAGMRRPLPVAEEDLEAIPVPADDQQRLGERDEIRDALSELPERQREAVVLRYFYGLRYGEVATALGLSRTATEALLFRARRSLRVSLRPVVGLAIAVPVAVREQLALALPGFEERAASVALGVGVAGGVLGKLAAGSTGVKVATATVAVATVGAVGTVGPDRPAVPRADAAVEQSADVDGSGARSHGTGSDDDRSGHDGRTGDDDGDDRSGSGSGEGGDDRESDESDGVERTDDSAGSSDGAEEAEPDDDGSGASDDGGETTESDETSDSSGSGQGRSGHGGSSSTDADESLETTESDETSDSSESGSPGDDEARSGED